MSFEVAAVPVPEAARSARTAPSPDGRTRPANTASETTVQNNSAKNEFLFSIRPKSASRSFSLMISWSCPSLPARLMMLLYLSKPRFASFLPAHWTIEIANFLYLNAQFTIALGFLIWLYLFRNESYYFVRNMFVVSMGLALVGYTLFPTAPPRMFPEDGFVDTITEFSGVNHDSTLAKIFINPYAAVPSMHCAFALMIGATGVGVCRTRLAKSFWAIWPLLISWVVIVTGNHYWVDVALGWMVALTAALVAQRLLARARPHAWAWDRAPAAREAEA